VTERALERRARRRLAVLRHVEEVSGNVAATCRHYGISRQCYYGWLRRFAAALPLRASQDRHVPRPLPRGDDQRLRGCGGSSNGWGWTGYPPHSAINVEPCAGNAPRSNAPATSSKSTSNSSNH
jgi:Homeodomain-like domain